MQYKIVSASDEHESKCAHDLERLVNDLGYHGWKLQGGVAVTVRKADGFYSQKYTMHQAMVKDD